MGEGEADAFSRDVGSSVNEIVRNARAKGKTGYSNQNALA